MSPSCKEVLGYDADEMIGRPLAKLYCTPAEREKILNALREGNGHAGTSKPACGIEMAPGVWISTNAYMRLDEQGQIHRRRRLARDISERKRDGR